MNVLEEAENTRVRFRTSFFPSLPEVVRGSRLHIDTQSPRTYTFRTDNDPLDKILVTTIREFGVSRGDGIRIESRVVCETAWNDWRRPRRYVEQ